LIGFFDLIRILKLLEALASQSLITSSMLIPELQVFEDQLIVYALEDLLNLAQDFLMHYLVNKAPGQLVHPLEDFMVVADSRL